MDLLKSRKITARYLSDKYEISLRSVYRYVDVLSSSGVPVFSERGRRGGITIADNYRLPATLLTKTEQSDILSALSLYKGADPLCDVDVIRDKLLSVNTSDDAEKLIMSKALSATKNFIVRKSSRCRKQSTKTKKSPSYITTAAAKSQPARFTRTLSC